VETGMPPRFGMIAGKVLIGLTAYEGYKAYQFWDLRDQQDQLLREMNDSNFSDAQYFRAVEQYKKVTKQIDDWSPIKP
jgi:phage anti-repressor protein